MRNDQKKGKIISRILYRALKCGVCHLSDAAYPPASDEQPLTAGICGLAEGGAGTLCVAAQSRSLLRSVLTLTLSGGCFLPGAPQAFARL